MDAVQLALQPTPRSHTTQASQLRKPIMATSQASSSSQPPPPLPTLSNARHGTLHIRHLRLLPGAYAEAGGDSQRVTLAYFALAALDLLGLRGKIDEAERAEWIEWLWERQSSELASAAAASERRGAHLIAFPSLTSRLGRLHGIVSFGLCCI